MGQHAEHRSLVAAALAAALAVAAPVPALAEGAACRLALAFALDVSASVDGDEFVLQRDGLAGALADPAVRAAVLASPVPVAFAAYEWSGRNQQVMIADWTVVGTEAELEGFAAAVSAHRRGYSEFPTAIGYALGYGANLLRRSPPCLRRVIDISGDGLGNEGFPPAAAYRHFPFEGVTVNGLVVGGEDIELISFYQSQVAHGPGAFVEVAADFADYARAMRRKLLRELGSDFLAAAEGPAQR